MSKLFDIPVSGKSEPVVGGTPSAPPVAVSPAMLGFQGNGIPIGADVSWKVIEASATKEAMSTTAFIVHSIRADKSGNAHAASDPVEICIDMTRLGDLNYTKRQLTHMTCSEPDQPALNEILDTMYVHDCSIVSGVPVMGVGSIFREMIGKLPLQSRRKIFEIHAEMRNNHPKGMPCDAHLEMESLVAAPEACVPENADQCHLLLLDIYRSCCYSMLCPPPKEEAPLEITMYEGFHEDKEASLLIADLLARNFGVKVEIVETVPSTDHPKPIYLPKSRNAIQFASQHDTEYRYCFFEDTAKMLADNVGIEAKHEIEPIAGKRKLFFVSKPELESQASGIIHKHYPTLYIFKYPVVYTISFPQPQPQIIEKEVIKEVIKTVQTDKACEICENRQQERNEEKKSVSFNAAPDVMCFTSDSKPSPSENSQYRLSGNEIPHPQTPKPNPLQPFFGASSYNPASIEKAVPTLHQNQEVPIRFGGLRTDKMSGTVLSAIMSIRNNYDKAELESAVRVMFSGRPHDKLVADRISCSAKAVKEYRGTVDLEETKYIRKEIVEGVPKAEFFSMMFEFMNNRMRTTALLDILMVTAVVIQEQKGLYTVIDSKGGPLVIPNNI